MTHRPTGRENSCQAGTRCYSCHYPELPALCLQILGTPWQAICPWVGDTVWAPLGWNTRYNFSTLQMSHIHLPLPVVLRPLRQGTVTSRLCYSCDRWVVAQFKSLLVPRSEQCPSTPSIIMIASFLWMFLTAEVTFLLSSSVVWLGNRGRKLQHKIQIRGFFEELEVGHNKNANSMLQSSSPPVRWFCTKRKLLQMPCNLVSVISGHERTSQNKPFCSDFPRERLALTALSFWAERI